MEDDNSPLTNGESLTLANMLMALNAPVAFSCEYTNWRGETSRRRLVAIELWHGTTRLHRKPGLMLKAIDRDRGLMRDFRVADFNLDTLRGA